MNRLTIDEIFEQQLNDRQPDPIVAEFVLRLDDQASLFIRSAESDDWPANYESGLEMCRITQQVRLEIGELYTLDRVSRNRFGETLKRVVDLISDPIRFAQAYYPAANQQWGMRALTNITDRYDELARTSSCNESSHSPR